MSEERQPDFNDLAKFKADVISAEYNTLFATLDACDSETVKKHEKRVEAFLYETDIRCDCYVQAADVARKNYQYFSKLAYDVAYKRDHIRKMWFNKRTGGEARKGDGDS